MSAPVPRKVAFDDEPVRAHRRPSGEPPPLAREWDRAGTFWLVLLGVACIVWFSTIRFESPRLWFTDRDLDLMEPLVDLRTAWLTSAAREVQRVGLHWLIPILGWSTIVAIAIARRWRHLFVFLGSLLIVGGAAYGLSLLIKRPRPFGIETLGEWQGWAHPSIDTALLTATCVGACATAIPRGAWRTRGFIATGAVLFLFGVAQVYLGVDHPTDVVFAIALGGAVPLILVRLLVPEKVFPVTYGRRRTAHLDVTGARATAVHDAVGARLGLAVTELTPVGLEGSSGSTPIRLTIAGDPDYSLFGKIYARNHLRSDRWYKLVRQLRYGRLEDETRYPSVRRLVQHEDYMLHVFESYGIPSAAPYGIVEITPDIEYLIVTEYIQDATEILDAEIDDEIIDRALGIIQTMWASSLAHRDVKPANVMVKSRRVYLIDLAFGEVNPSSWRHAVDLANMMLILALGSTPEHVLERARRKFTDDELAEAFAASRGITLPSQLRRELRADGRSLLDQYRALLPETRPIRIQRWSLRRAGFTATALLVLGLGTGLVLTNLEAVGLL